MFGDVDFFSKWKTVPESRPRRKTVVDNKNECGYANGNDRKRRMEIESRRLHLRLRRDRLAMEERMLDVKRQKMELEHEYELLDVRENTIGFSCGEDDDEGDMMVSDSEFLESSA